MITRGGFISSGAVFAASVPFALSGKAGEVPNLRIGVLSDPHMKGEGSEEPFEKALRAFDRIKVDAVACCGDLATSGIVPELERVGRAWNRVFPGNRRSDGAPVSNLFIYGDHDMGGYAWRESKGIMPDDKLKKLSIPLNDPGALWERCFGEKWAPVVVKEVKGYRFVLAHHPMHNKDTKWGDTIPGVRDALRRHRQELAGNRPFFYLQHRLLKGTVGGKIAWGQDSGDAKEALSAFPNCIALTGHGHIACTDERSIWQGEFTVLEVPSIRYCVPFTGCENSPSLPAGTPNEKDRRKEMLMPGIAMRDARQGFVMDVFDRRIVIQRLDFAYADGERIAADWVVPLPFGRFRPYAYDVRAAKERAPQFAEGASVRVRRISSKTRGGKKVDCIEVSFPTACSLGAVPRANRYEISAICDDGTVSVKEVFSPKFCLHEGFDGGRVKCLFSVSGFSGNPEKVRFLVRPLGAFGAKGKAIS